MTYSGRFTHISGYPPAAGRAQDRESSPAKDRRSTSVPRNQQCNNSAVAKWVDVVQFVLTNLARSGATCKNCKELAAKQPITLLLNKKTAVFEFITNKVV